MYEEAIEAWKQVIRIDTDNAAAHVNLGNAYVCLNDKGSALEQHKILKSIDPELANYLFNSIDEM
jgi:tetratricopeptide (TPR) repeat protein